MKKDTMEKQRISSFFTTILNYKVIGAIESSNGKSLRVKTQSLDDKFYRNVEISKDVLGNRIVEKDCIISGIGYVSAWVHLNKAYLKIVIVDQLQIIPK